MAGRFTELPPVPDHPRVEEAILDLWEREATFEKLRELNRGGPRFSFIDGPVTANKGMGVHTAWGRTLKDVFQRYKALQGFYQRYQNGWDCQGLWIDHDQRRERHPHNAGPGPRQPRLILNVAKRTAAVATPYRREPISGRGRNEIAPPRGLR